MKKSSMSKCNDCKNRDTEKSNANWTVCPAMPLEVIVAGTSKDCKKYLSK
jgi:hypothetical protein